MPIYEFVCGSCGHEFEKILSFSATASPACGSCGAENVERQMGRPAIHFKGSGWYINDSKKSTAKTGNNNLASATSGENGDSGGDGGAESPQAEKSEGAESDKSKNGEAKAVDNSKEKPASKETTSSPAKVEAV